MMLLAVVALVSPLLAISHAGNCDQNKILFYKELGCTIESEKDGCPNSFACREYTPKEDTCYYQGNTYKLGEGIPPNMTDASCNVACLCTSGYTSPKATIICASLDCPYHGLILGPDDADKECYSTYTLKACCSTGQKCVKMGKDANVETCEVDGKTYKYGEKFTPNGTCINCICGEGFKSGEYKEPHCQIDQCGFEIHEAENLEKNCAPAYFFGEHCCPRAFVCEDGKEVITSKETTDKKCKYGKKELNLGDTFTKTVEYFSSHINVTCSCDIPPYVTCSSPEK